MYIECFCVLCNYYVSYLILTITSEIDTDIFILYMRNLRSHI